MWHHRLVLIDATPAAVEAMFPGTVIQPGEDYWWILTPDGHVYPEALSVGPLSGMVTLDLDGNPEADYAVGTTSYLARRYMFGTAPTVRQLYRAMQEVEEIQTGAVDVFYQRFGARGVGVPTGGKALVPAPAPPMGFANIVGDMPKPMHKWVVRASDGPHRLGHAVDDVKGPGMMGLGFAIGRVDGVAVVVEDANDTPRPPAGHGGGDDGGGGGGGGKGGDKGDKGDKGGGDDDDLDKDDDEPEDDARVLSVQRDSGGARFRPFRDVVPVLTETAWANWPVSGPRTVVWCAKFIAEVDGHPRARHQRWLHETQLTAADVMVSEHETALRALEMAMTYDQLQVGEIASLELVMRRAQLAEMKHRERTLTKAGISIDSHVFEENFYLGHQEGRGQEAPAPPLYIFRAMCL